MTNQEYEKACVTAAGAADFFEGEHKLQQCDKAITVLEEAITRLQEERREIINRYNLNKCEHDINWRFEDGGPVYFCTKCKEVMS
ncbi:hypothetical protein OCJ83_004455 [Salmonella enterica]|nr:hypothetical protein [Salmonella enterica]